jgi:hypothetical protein
MNSYLNHNLFRFRDRIFKYCSALALLALLAGNVYAQGYYTSKKGQVIVQSVYYDTVLVIKSDELIMQLDYGKANLKMSVDLNSFLSGNDSVNTKLEELTGKNVSFDGKLGIDYINTKPHLPQKFDFSGTLRYSGINVPVNGEGSLTHIFSNSEITSCILWLEFKFNTETLRWNLPEYGLSNVINVNIIQGILDYR